MDSGDGSCKQTGLSARDGQSVPLLRLHFGCSSLGDRPFKNERMCLPWGIADTY